MHRVLYLEYCSPRGIASTYPTNKTRKQQCEPEVLSNCMCATWKHTLGWTEWAVRAFVNERTQDSITALVDIQITRNHNADAVAVRLDKFTGKKGIMQERNEKT